MLLQCCQLLYPPQLALTIRPGDFSPELMTPV